MKRTDVIEGIERLRAALSEIDKGLAGPLDAEAQQECQAALAQLASFAATLAADAAKGVTE